MELAAIEMPVEDAQRLFEEYRAAVRERHDAEDAQIMRGYRALAKGHQVIALSRTLRAGGTTALRVAKRWGDGAVSVTLPRLAVARANRTTVWTRGIGEDGSLTMQTKRDPHPNNRYDIMQLAAGTFDPGTREEWGSPRIRAIVPNVPPRLRPRGALGNYHVLFEAEWGLEPEPPVDPALLRHIGGDLYVVVATWDLTEIERAVLSGSR